MTPALIALVGPTAVGKTDVSIELALRLGAEIVGCDSMQVYRGLPVLSQQPTPDQRARVPHHLIDCVDQSALFNTGRYRQLALPIIEDIQRRGKAVLIVGGTGLYLKGLMEGLCEAPPADAAVRERLVQRVREDGVDTLYAELVEQDPVAAKGIGPTDARRIVRALEVLAMTGRPLSSFWEEQSPGMPIAVIGLTRERAELNDRINHRMLAMLDGGGVLEEAVRALALPLSDTSRQIHGLPYLAQFVAGTLGREELIAAWQQQVRQYAKRQMTWFRGVPGIRWVELRGAEPSARTTERILAELVPAGGP